MKITKLDKAFIRLDVILYKKTEKFFRKILREDKFKYNKYQLYIKLVKLKMMVVTPICFGSLLIDDVDNLGYVGAITMALLFAGIFISLDLMNYKLVKNRADDWEEIFMNRKHPRIYALVKEHLVLKFRADAPLRLKHLKLFITVLGVFYGMIGTSIIMSIISGHTSILFLVYFAYFPVSHLFSIWDLYLNYIFDFDEPDKKSKRVKDSVTEIVKQQFENLVRGMKPSIKPF